MVKLHLLGRVYRRGRGYADSLLNQLRRRLKMDLMMKWRGFGSPENAKNLNKIYSAYKIGHFSILRENFFPFPPTISQPFPLPTT
jgi:hypothetical protein